MVIIIFLLSLLTMCVVIGLIIGFLQGINKILRRRRVNSGFSQQRPSPFWRSLAFLVYYWFMLGMGISWFLVITEGTQISNWNELTWGFGYGLLFGSIGGLFYSIRTGQQTNRQDILIVETLRFEWKRALRGAILGMPVAMVISYPINPVSWREFLVIGALFGTMFGGFGQYNVETKTRPNQGIRLTLKNAIQMWFIGFLGGGFLIGFFFWLVTYYSQGDYSFALQIGLAFGSLSGAFLGVLALVRYGGLDVIQHYVLRALLWRTKQFPWNILSFLDEANDHIFLRKVGTGYIFIHRYMLEYFASLIPEKEAEISE